MGFSLVDIAINIILLTILICVCVIDWREQIIPDSLWIALAVLGMVRIVCGYAGLLGDPMPVTLTDALVGAFAASTPLLILAYLTDGFGGGDIKLMFAAGIFLGWQQVLLALSIGIVLGATVAVVLLVLKRATRKTAIAFGPYLAIGIALATFWGPAIVEVYSTI